MFFSNNLVQRRGDPYLRPTVVLNPDVTTLSGRTRVDPTTISPTALNLIYLGQSTNQNSITGGPRVLDNPNDMFNMSIAHGGATFLAQEPLLTSDITDGHQGVYAADELINQGIVDQVVLTAVAIGGSAVEDWVPGGEASYRISLAQRCIENAGLDNLRTIIDWEQGQKNSDLGTSQVSYRNSLKAVVAECKRAGLLRRGRRMFIHQATNLTQSPDARNAIRNAQYSVPDGDLVLHGADIDTIGKEYRPTAEYRHLNVAGCVLQVGLKVPLYRNVLPDLY